mgnify:CR=1 FL=1
MRMSFVDYIAIINLRTIFFRFGEDGFVEPKQEINSDSELPSPRYAALKLVLRGTEVSEHYIKCIAGVIIVDFDSFFPLRIKLRRRKIPPPEIL